ncbi:hypothetical protein [Alicyclobacillus mengziensis]|uniref:Uncharacterized protein n=1 Tax=Alicyclobacillus mengziensis TaxID=2931921 RepID=A0A9X7W1B0_9BACL|nr:hypothetical protein [Alicyclobacillus mengziensis]QSO48375.1 hypothetical protein JZ786_05145 [Alicyclobacillus mengziensis]
MDEMLSSSEHSKRNQFVRELVQRLHDGCSVTFAVPRDSGTVVAKEPLRALRERGCLTAYLDLSSVDSIDKFGDALNQTYLSLLSGDTGWSNSIKGLLGNLSDPDVEKQIQDIVDEVDLKRMSAREKVDWAFGLSERLAESLDTRVVVWFHEWQSIAHMKDGDLLLKRLRGMFQLQTHVTYAFTGSRDTDLLRTLFSDRHQPFYRFAVELHFPG